MEPDYAVLKEIKPVLTGYIREAQFMLSPEEKPDEKVVHDIRVLMKKAKASLSLLKSRIDENAFNKEYNSFREVGRIMRSWRETSVHRKILKELRKKYPEIIILLSENEKISSLLRKPAAPDGDPVNLNEELTRILDLLHKSEYRIRFREIKNPDPHFLLKELEETYNQVSDCYLKARNYPKPSNLHEFRKKAKDFLYQLCFFRTIKPGVVRDLEKRLDYLTQNLGKYNDLDVLIKTIGYRYSKTDRNSALDELIIIIKQEQDRYLSKLWPQAYRIFCPGRKLGNLLGFKLLVI